MNENITPDPDWLHVQHLLQSGDDDQAMLWMASAKANGGVAPDDGE